MPGSSIRIAVKESNHRSPRDADSCDCIFHLTYDIRSLRTCATCSALEPQRTFRSCSNHPGTHATWSYSKSMCRPSYMASTTHSNATVRVPLRHAFPRAGAQLNAQAHLQGSGQSHPEQYYARGAALWGLQSHVVQPSSHLVVSCPHTSVTMRHKQRAM